MPMYDFYCTKCGAEKTDELVKNSTVVVNCDVCYTEMKRKPPEINFKIVGGSITALKRKYGNTNTDVIHKELQKTNKDNGVRFEPPKPRKTD